MSVLSAPPIVGRPRAGVPALRLPLVFVLVTVAALPVLVPHLPGNTGPVDGPLFLAVVSLAAAAAFAGVRIDVPYAFPVGLLVAAGALAGVVSANGQGLLALAQDLFLLCWVATITTVTRRPDNRRLILKFWAGSATIWAGVLLVAVSAHYDALSGVGPRDGPRASLTLGDPNVAASYFVMSLFLLLAIGWPRPLLVRWGCSGLLCYAVV